MIVIETERLSLRYLTNDDVKFILVLLNEPSFIKNIGDKGVRTLKDAEQYLLNGPIASYKQFGFGLYLVELKDSGTPIGICGLLKRASLEHVDIGFAFLPEYWSKGYAYESAAAVMAYGRNVIGLDHIVAITAPTNQSSINVLKKIGLQFEKLIKLSGEGSDTSLFTDFNPQKLS